MSRVTPLLRFDGRGFTNARSFTVDRETQAGMYPSRGTLSKGGEIQRSRWLKDRFGFSRQIVPHLPMASMRNLGPGRAGRVMAAVMTMTRLDIAVLRDACDA